MKYSIPVLLGLLIFGAACSSSSPSTGPVTLTTSELAKHASGSDCWLLISGKFYDVTEYMGQHPGGTQNILRACGTDATQAFATMDGRGGHSAQAYGDLEHYLLGSLGQTIS